MAGSKAHPAGKSDSKDFRKAKQESGKKRIKSRTGNVKPAGTVFERSGIYLDKHIRTVFVASLLITLVFSLLLFDIRFSMAGDDSAFVIRASEFLTHFTFPGFSGPLYPIVLSPFTGIFGISAIPLKCLSLLFILCTLCFTYMAFKDRISSVLLSALMILFSVNSYVLYYASQTYSEAFFMFIQSVAFYLFFSRLIGNEEGKSCRTMISRHMLMAACILALGLTRTIGFSALIAVSAYFISRARWKDLLLCILSFTVIFALFQGFKLLLWGNSGLHFTGQFDNLIAKNYYDTGAGQEDLPGFVNRVLENSRYYFSDSLYVLSGFREMKVAGESYPLLSLFTWLMLIAATVISSGRNKYLLFTGIYTLVFIFLTFLITQSIWRQSRLIIPFYPLILLLLLSLVFHVLSHRKLKKFQWVFPVFILLLFGLSLRTTAIETRKVRQIENKYSGLTPDWENYCKLSEWASENLQQNAVVACRKPSVSFIYGHGRQFFGINRIISSPGDLLLQEDVQKKLRYYFISPASIDKHPLPDALFYSLKSGLIGYGLVNNLGTLSMPFYIMKFPDEINLKTQAEIKQSEIKGTDNIDTLKTWLTDLKAKITLIYPDSMLIFLRKAGVTHVITASLRADPGEKNGYTDNTVERFMDYIRYKYPDLMIKMVQMGTDDNEPAVLYQINYEKAGFRRSD